MPSVKWLAFDLDGTLVDSSPDIALSINTMFSQLGVGSVEEQVVRTWIGRGADKLLEQALEHAYQQPIDDDLKLKAKEYFYAAYTENAVNLTRCYPHCLETLASLKQAGIKMACVTNKPREFVLPLFEQFQFDEYFPVLVCGDDLPVKKPDPQLLLHALDQLGEHVDHGYMIGDSETDILTAKNATAGAIYVTYGYNRGVSVEQYAPTVIDSLQELIPMFCNESIQNVSSSK